MKKNAAVQHSAVINQPSDRRRKSLSRLLRVFVAVLILSLLLLSVAATIAIFRPFTVTMLTPMFAYRHQTQPSYSVLLSENPFFNESSQPSGQTYLREFSQAVQIRFNSAFRAIFSDGLTLKRQVDASLIIRDVNDPSVILLEKITNLIPTENTSLLSGQDTVVTEATVELASYHQTAADFLSQTGLQGRAELVIRFAADAMGSRFDQVLSDHQESSVTIPLLQDRFQITMDEAKANRLIIRPVQYLFSPHRVPIFIFPSLILFFLVMLILFLLLTENRSNDRFKRDLSRMLRYARRQLLIIGDKAWEPEWCITASDYKSLVRTARKLKHPVFCHVQNDPEHPAAYFYVYYGENNYCYTFKGRPAKKGRPFSTKAVPPNKSDAKSIDPNAGLNFSDPAQITFYDEPSSLVVPLLPETEDTPEIVLERLRRGPGQLPF